jgi:hypothetical protein
MYFALCNNTHDMCYIYIQRLKTSIKSKNPARDTRDRVKSEVVNPNKSLKLYKIKNMITVKSLKKIVVRERLKV